MARFARSPSCMGMLGAVVLGAVLAVTSAGSSGDEAAPRRPTVRPQALARPTIN